MYCRRCVEDLPAGSSGLESVATARPSEEAALTPRFCRRCGAPIVGAESEDPMSRKAAELERFGLAGGGGPLLGGKRGG
jgi:hypothetical protein